MKIILNIYFYSWSRETAPMGLQKPGAEAPTKHVLAPMHTDGKADILYEHMWEWKVWGACSSVVSTPNLWGMATCHDFESRQPD